MSATLTAVETDALKGFFSARRGHRELRKVVITKLVDYMSKRGTSLRELTTSTPSTSAEVEVLMEEFKEYGEAAGLDKIDGSSGRDITASALTS